MTLVCFTRSPPSYLQTQTNEAGAKTEQDLRLTMPPETVPLTGQREAALRRSKLQSANHLNGEIDAPKPNRVRSVRYLPPECPVRFPETPPQYRVPGSLSVTLSLTPVALLHASHCGNWRTVSVELF